MGMRAHVRKKNIVEVLESWVATVEDHPENYSNTDYIDIDWF